MSVPEPTPAAQVAAVKQLAGEILERLGTEPAPAAIVIAGSGLGGFVRSVKPVRRVSYADLPGVGASTVAGHSGEVILGTVQSSSGAETPLLLLNGRRHLYEGIDAADATRLLRALLSAYGASVRGVVVSNAAGGLNPGFDVGDLMLISDHFNNLNRNPLLGPNVAEWGPRFPDLSRCWSPEVRALAREAALEAGVVVREGVYLAGLGPSYETRAEVGMLRHIYGADAVGMSTVPEGLVCAHLNVRALGISFISNSLVKPAPTTHEEVMENARLVEGKFTALLQSVLPRLAALPANV